MRTKNCGSDGKKEHATWARLSSSSMRNWVKSSSLVLEAISHTLEAFKVWTLSWFLQLLLGSPRKSFFGLHPMMLLSGIQQRFWFVLTVSLLIAEPVLGRRGWLFYVNTSFISNRERREENDKRGIWCQRGGKIHSPPFYLGEFLAIIAKNQPLCKFSASSLTEETITNLTWGQVLPDTKISTCSI